VNSFGSPLFGIPCRDILAENLFKRTGNRIAGKNSAGHGIKCFSIVRSSFKTYHKIPKWIKKSPAIPAYFFKRFFLPILTFAEITDIFGKLKIYPPNLSPELKAAPMPRRIKA
jgi:hypothetical protein